MTLAQLTYEISERFGGLPSNLRFSQAGTHLTADHMINVSIKAQSSLG